MDKHVQILGIFWIVLGSISFLAGFIIFGVLIGISFFPDLGNEAPSILRIVGSSVGLFLWILSVPKIICGIGLLKRYEWARILTLIIAFLGLLNIPLGTALGIYSFIILLKDDTIKLFNKNYAGKS